jgi:cytochrome P450
MLQFTTYLLIFGILGSTILWLGRNPKSKLIPKGLREVPGPKGLPLVGNTLSLGSQPQRLLRKWAVEYGELFQIQMGWDTWVFVNSPAAVKEIFDKQSAITSGRPQMPVASLLVSGGMRFLLMDNTLEWRKLRSMVHKLLTPKMSDAFVPSQEFEAKQLMYDLLTDNPKETEFYNHIRRYTLSVVMTSTYGRRVCEWVCFPRFVKLAAELTIS